VRLAAIRDALDRAGLIAPRKLDLSVGPTTRHLGLAFWPTCFPPSRRHRVGCASLDPALEAKVRLSFAPGDSETACFTAMKEVEVAVRKAGGLDNSIIGVPLMKKAFTPNGGPLTDAGADGGEQVTTMELFAGAIGAFKNPSSH
jgi:uncharacterized protein (TIGR02391 family)